MDENWGYPHVRTSPYRFRKTIMRLAKNSSYWIDGRRSAGGYILKPFEPAFSSFKNGRNCQRMTFCEQPWKILEVFGWLVVWNMNLMFPFSWEFHHPNWRTPSFFRGVGWNHQPAANLWQSKKTMNHSCREHPGVMKDDPPDVMGAK